MNFVQTTGIALAAMLTVSGCGAKEPPTQVVYRFDDHRYLELKGWNCEGELWYTDTQRGIHSQPYFQFYRIFTKKYIHPSERYMVITSWEPGGFIVSKDYGKTWTTATFSPGENEPNGDSSPPREDIVSFTVENDQGFLQTKHRLYMSSKPFNDPRLTVDGPGITYTASDGAVHHIDPKFPGWAWGMVYMTKQGLNESTEQFKTNWQDQPDEVPEVKNYKGWDHMQCDMDAGK